MSVVIKAVWVIGEVVINFTVVECVWKCEEVVEKCVKV